MNRKSSVSPLALVAEIAAGAASGAGDLLSASRSLARCGGAEDILIFRYDYEVRTFLPAPSFPQTLPESVAWQRFILGVDEEGAAADLPSPYHPQKRCPVEARRVDSATVVALLGKKTGRPGRRQAEDFWLAARVLGRLFGAAHEVRLANARARLASDNARSTSELAASLLATRRKLEASLAETRREREKLRETNERLELAQQIASLGMWEWNPREGSLFLSDAMRRMCGAAEGAAPRSMREILSMLDSAGRAAMGRAVRQVLRTGDPAEVEVHLQASDGDHWILSRIASGADAQGNLRLLGACLDMTRRHQSEEALRRSERLASTGRLAATIAHEINNPLESVLNLLYIIGLDDTLSFDSRECLKLAEREIGRVSHIARQTLAFYRDTTAPVEIEIEPLLQELFELYQPRLRLFTVSMDSALPGEFRLYGYRGELKQLFSNLLANAIDAINAAADGAPGSLRVTADCAEGLLRVSMRDTGTGIEPEHMASLFQPFFTTKSQTGTGLGLWVSDGIARKHGGRIEVQSSVDPGNRGTTMTVYLAGAAAPAQS